MPSHSRAVHVGVRVRPPLPGEHVHWRVNGSNVVEAGASRQAKHFAFEHVFDTDCTNADVFRTMALEMLEEATLKGYNATCFAYGQTASGKTHTMMGPADEPGTIPLALTAMFSHMATQQSHEFLVRLSYIEIYKEVLSDLLSESKDREHLTICEHPRKGPFVKGLTKHVISSAAAARSFIKRGERKRHFGRTDMNEVSSRSHTILRLEVESRISTHAKSGTPSNLALSRPRRGSQHGVEQVHPLAVALRRSKSKGQAFSTELNFVDLAGSERISKTNATGERVEEAGYINASLMTLGKIIHFLSTKGFKGHLPLRDSKLTRLLSNCLGGNSITSLICCVSGGKSNAEETRGTLLFASRAKRVMNKVSCNRVPEFDSMLDRFKAEAQELRIKLQSNQGKLRSLENAMKASEVQHAANMEKVREEMFAAVAAKEKEEGRREEAEQIFAERARELERRERQMAEELKQARNDANERAEASQVEVERLRAEEARLRKQVSNDKKMIEAEQQHERELERNLEKEKEKEHKLYGELCQLSRVEARMESELADTKSRLVSANKRINSLESQVNKAIKARDVAIAQRDELEGFQLDVDMTRRKLADASSRANQLEKDVKRERMKAEMSEKRAAKMAENLNVQLARKEESSHKIELRVNELEAEVENLEEKLKQARSELGVTRMKLSVSSTKQNSRGLELESALSEVAGLRAALRERTAYVAEIEGRQATSEREMECLRERYETKLQTERSKLVASSTSFAKVRASNEDTLATVKAMRMLDRSTAENEAESLRTTLAHEREKLVQILEAVEGDQAVYVTHVRELCQHLRCALTMFSRPAHEKSDGDGCQQARIPERQSELNIKDEDLATPSPSPEIVGKRLRETESGGAQQQPPSTSRAPEVLFDAVSKQLLGAEFRRAFEITAELLAVTRARVDSDSETLIIKRRLESQLEKLQLEKSQLEEENAKVKTNTLELESQLHELQKRLDAAYESAAELRTVASSSSQQISVLSDEIETQRTATLSCEAVTTDLRTELAHALSLNDEKETKLNEAHARIATLDAARSQASDEVSKAREAAAVHNSSILELRQRVKQLEIDLEASRKMVRRFDTVTKALEEKLSTSQVEVESAVSASRAAELEVMKLREVVLSERQSRLTAEALRGAAEEEAECARGESKEICSKLNNAAAEMEHRLQEHLAITRRRDEAVEAKAARVAQRLSLTREHAQEVRGELNEILEHLGEPLSGDDITAPSPTRWRVTLGAEVMSGTALDGSPLPQRQRSLTYSEVLSRSWVSGEGLGPADLENRDRAGSQADVRAMIEVSRSLAEVFNVHDLFSSVPQHVLNLTGGDVATVFLHSSFTNAKDRGCVGRQLWTQDFSTPRCLPLEDVGIANMVAKSCNTVCIKDDRHLLRLAFEEVLPDSQEGTATAALCAPILRSVRREHGQVEHNSERTIMDDRTDCNQVDVLGVVEVLKLGNGGHFGSDDIAILEWLCDRIAVLILSRLESHSPVRYIGFGASNIE